MERKLPEYKIEGTIFEVDVINGFLREKESPNNRIPFSDMDFETTYYDFIYSLQTKNAPLGYPDEPVIDLRIPLRKELDPEGMGLRNNISVELVEQTSEFDLFNDPALLRDRMLGMQPTIDIEGHPFFVDLFGMCLRPKDDFSTFIDLRSLADNQAGDGYAFLYNPKTHSVVDVDSNLIELKEGMVTVEIPDEIRMDPYGFAYTNDFDTKATESFLLKYPIQKDLKAVRVPFEETRIPEIIKGNRAKKSLPLEEEERKQQRGRSR